MTWPLKQVPQVILASQSAARKELLESTGIEVITRPTHCDENCSYTDPLQFPLVLAKRKMDAYLAENVMTSIPVITCDTIVEYRGEIIGKPDTFEEAYRYISGFSGSSHLVVSAYSLLYGSRLYSGYETAEVLFNPLSPDDIHLHLDHTDYHACAGAYRIQNQVIPLIKEIKGHFSTVVGLPLERISAILSSPDSFVSEEYPPHGEK